MDQNSTITGSVYKVYDTASQDYTFGRMPSVGSRYKDSLGREFVFVSTAVDVAAGQVVSAPAVPAEIVDGITAVAAGNTEVTIVKAGAVVNAYAGGMLVITVGSRQTAYAIRKSTVADASNKVILTLEDPLAKALVATDDALLVPSRFNKVVIGTATSDGVGVAIAPSTAATDSKTNFFWVQTKGIGLAITGTASSLTVGVKMILGAAGVVESQATNGILAEFGYVVSVLAVSNGDAVAAMLDFKG